MYVCPALSYLTPGVGPKPSTLSGLWVWQKGPWHRPSPLDAVVAQYLEEAGLVTADEPTCAMLSKGLVWF